MITLRELRREMQMVFQDSYSSLNPRLPIRDTIAFGPIVHGVPEKEARVRALQLLGNVGLDPDQSGLWRASDFGDADLDAVLRKFGPGIAWPFDQTNGSFGILEEADLDEFIRFGEAV